MRKQRLPKGWTEERMQSVLKYYENQTDEEAAAEDEAAFNDPRTTAMIIPKELVPAVRRLLARHAAASSN